MNGAAPATRNRMESQQNMRVRHITGCIRPTSQRALLAVAGLPPLKHVAGERAAVLRERLLRLPEGSPALETATRMTVPRLKSKVFEARKRQGLATTPGKFVTDESRPWKGCWRRIARETTGAQELDEFNRDAPGSWPIAPWEHTNPEVSFTLEMVDLCALRSLSVSTRAARAKEFLAGLLPTDIEIWTDGSAEEAVANGGGAAVITTKLLCTRLYVAAGLHCSSYQAEMAAIVTGLEFCVGLNRETHGSTIRLLSDSLSGLSALSQGQESQDTTSGVAAWRAMNSLGAVDLVWVPAHCGLDGNELADIAADKARQLPQDHVPIPLRTAKAVLKRERRARDRLFYGEFAEHAGHRVRGCTRWEEVTVNQFRAGASSLCAATIHAFRPEESPDCRDCGELDTETHVLLECPRGAAARLSLFGLEATASDVLRDPRRLLQLLKTMGRTHIGA
jgi:ribonuclease HI